MSPARSGFPLFSIGDYVGIGERGYPGIVQGRSVFGGRLLVFVGGKTRHTNEPADDLTALSEAEYVARCKALRPKG